MRWEGEEGHRRPWLGASRSMSLAEVLILDLVVIVLGEELPVVATTLGRRQWSWGRRPGPTQWSCDCSSHRCRGSEVGVDLTRCSGGPGKGGAVTETLRRGEGRAMMVSFRRCHRRG
jgi:hypothetical protein